jgi:hypothetical protein
MDPEICHDSFTYLVVFREPLARIASHWAYQYKSSNKGDIPATIFEDVQYYAPKDKDWTATSKTTLNNFYIRTLLGLEAYTTHDYINETHLIKAKTRLSLFDYVLIQERFSEAGVVFASLGWTEQYVHMAMLGNRRNVHSHSTFEHAFAPDEAEWLVEHNILDQRLYSFAESLFDTLLSQISQ